MELKDLKFKRNKLLTDMQALAMKGFTAESRAQFDTMNAEVETLEADIVRSERLAAISAEQSSFTRSARPGAANGGVDGTKSADQVKDETRAAFRQYARGGIANMTQEQRDLVSTNSNGQALIPQMFNPELIAALKYYGPIATLVRQRVTDNNGAPLKVSLANDTANGLTLLGTEGSSSPAETDPAFQSSIVGVDTLSGGLVKVSFQELEDSSFDLDTWIREAFGLRYARGLERAVTLGKDSAGTTLPNQTAGGMAAGAVVSGTTSSLAAGIGWDDLTAAFGALDPAYTTDKAVWQMNSGTRGYLVGLKDGFGRPFFTPDPSLDSPFSRLMGFKVVLNQALPNMGANALPILFGDPSAAYLLRTDGQPTILRLNERYADTLEVGFFLYMRAGGTSIVATSAPNPLVSIKQASS
jgi:HK97 family phage major capsid protein